MGKYLYPRELEDMEKLIESESLYEVIETASEAELVGVCYVIHATAPEKRDEFGGIFIRDDVRDLGVATVLGRCAISNHLAWSPSRERMIAHVHEFNSEPRAFLQQWLGFVRNGEEVLPDEAVKPSMEKNKDGKVVGHLFEFQRKTLADFADWFQNFSGTFRGKRDEHSGLKIELKLFSFLDDALLALRDLSKT